MKKIALGFIIFMQAGVIIAQNQAPAFHRFSLEDCLQYAMGNNYNHQTLKLTEDASKDIYEQSKKERLPNLNASLNESLTNSKADASSWNGSYGINSNLTLYKGGSITNTIDQNKLKLEQTGFQTFEYENTLTIQILQSFITILGNQELLTYQYAVSKASAESLKQGEIQFKAGQILESDYMLLEAQHVNDENNISDTKIAIQNALLSLKSLLSINSEDSIEIIRPDTAIISQISMLPAMDIVLDKSLSTMPDLKVSQYGINIAKVGVKLAHATYYPTVSLYGNAGTGHMNTYNDFGTQLANARNEQLGISVSIPIYDNSRTKSKVTQSRIALQQAELDKKQTEIDIRQNVENEYRDVVSTYNKYKTNNIRQNAYLKTFEAYQIQFNVGAITAVDLLQQQNNYISALNDFIQSKYGFILKRKILDVYMGVPVTM